jgi:hypothetical protein
MKYAIQGPRGVINRISDTEPRFVGENTTVVEITDEQASQVQAGRESYPKQLYTIEDGELVDFRAYLKRQAFLDQPLEEAKVSKVTEFQRLAKAESDSDITVEGIGIFHVDAKTLIHLQTIEAAIAAGTSPLLVDGNYPNYKCVDGSFVTLSAANMSTIREAISGRDYGIYSVKLYGLSEQVEAATTTEELTAIVW